MMVTEPRVGSLPLAPQALGRLDCRLRPERRSALLGRTTRLKRALLPVVRPRPVTAEHPVSGRAVDAEAAPHFGRRPAMAAPLIAKRSSYQLRLRNSQSGHKTRREIVSKSLTRTDAQVYQVASPLCPKYGIPLARRGVLSLAEPELNLLFGANQNPTNALKLLKKRARGHIEKERQIDLFPQSED